MTEARAGEAWKWKFEKSPYALPVLMEVEIWRWRLEDNHDTLRECCRGYDRTITMPREDFFYEGHRKPQNKCLQEDGATS